MTQKHILVTGGGGYVGAQLVPSLLAKNLKVTVIDWFIYGNVFAAYKKNPRLIMIKGDIRDAALVDKALKGIDSVIHLACISNDPSFELDPTLGKSINYDATVSLIDQSRDAGVKRFVYASSSSVYGVKKEKSVTENLRLEPLTDYSRYKALCEKYLLTKTTPAFTTLVLRPSTVCGYSPRMRLDLTVNLLTIQALVNKKITVFGGKQKRPNIHMADMVAAYCKAITYPKALVAGKTYNVGYENYTVLEIAHMVKRTIGDNSIVIEIQPSNDLRSYHVSSEKIKKELGFVARHSVEEAIRDLVRAYKEGKIPNPLTDPRYYNIKTMQNAQMV